MKKRDEDQAAADKHTDDMLKLAVEILNGKGTDRATRLAAEIERGRARQRQR
jgi:hypothetical protein